MEIMDVLFELLRSDGSIIVNKKLARNLGLNEAIMYSELISKYKYFEDKGELTEDGFFFNTVENMEEDTTLTDHQQRKAIRNLIKKNLIQEVVKGIPAKRYFKIRTDYEALENLKKCLRNQENQQFLKILRTSSLKNAEQVAEKTQGNNTNNNTKEINNDNGFSAIAENTVPYNKNKEIASVISYYFQKYKLVKGIEHPKLKATQYKKVYDTLIGFAFEYGIDIEMWENMIERHFNRNIETDYNINHFATEGVLLNLMYEVAY